MAALAASAATATAKDEVEARLLASIEVITKGLQSSASNTVEMVGALRDFEDRVSKLERAVHPVHALTAKLTSAQKNINATLMNFEKVHMHFRAIDEVSGILQRSALVKSDDKREREQYYRALQRLCETHVFIEKHPEFMSSASHFKQLDTLRQFATDSMCIEFEVSLERHASSAEEYVGPHLDDDFEGEDALVMHENIPDDVIRRLRELAQCLVTCGLEGVFADAYARSRGRTVSDALDQLAAALWNEQGGPASASARLRANSRLRLTVHTAPALHVSPFASPNPSGQNFDPAARASAPALPSPPALSPQSPQPGPPPPPQAAAQTQEHPPHEAQSPATAKSGSQRIRSIYGKSLSGRSAQQTQSPQSTAQRSQVPDDDASDVGFQSTKSIKASKSKRWKDKLLGRGRRKSKLKEVDFSPQSLDSSASAAGRAPAPMPRTDRAPSAGASHPASASPNPEALEDQSTYPSTPQAAPPLITPETTGGLRAFLDQRPGQAAQLAAQSTLTSASSISSGASAAHNRKYVRGEHGMIELLELAIYALEAELAIAVRALPRGRVGRRLFLDGMVGPCERLARIGMKDGLEFTRQTYAAPEAVFAATDVLEKLQDLRPKFYDILAPGSISYLAEDAKEPGSPRKRSESADRVASSRRSEGALPQEAWAQFILLSKAWRTEAVQSLPRAYRALLQPIEKVPAAASVHPSSPRVLSFARRLCEYRKVVQPLLVPDNDESVTEEREEAEFRLNIEQLLSKYADALFAVTHGRGGAVAAAASALFLLNNVHYVFAGAQRDQGYLGGMMRTSELLRERRQDLEKAKDMYMTAVVSPVEAHLSTPSSLQAIPSDQANLASADKKLVHDYCAAWQTWVETMQGSQSRLEVPDFELRTELRFRVRNTLLASYTQGYTCLEANAYVQRKGMSTFLTYSPDVLSTMMSQFFEVSETSSDPRAVGSFASPR